jgi:hypothetical protein
VGLDEGGNLITDFFNTVISNQKTFNTSFPMS